jgi:hypothetical protein
VFYLTNGEDLVGVKLDYTVNVKDPLQPAALSGRIADAVNASRMFDGYSVVGYTIKAGLGEFDFGTVFDQFDWKAGHPALAEGTFNGRILLKSSAIDSLTAIHLDDAVVIESTVSAMNANVDETESSRIEEEGPATHDGNIIMDAPGDTQMLGTLGADVFKWTLAEPGAVDTIVDFSMSPPSDGGDVLDLRDLLPPESSGSLDSYLRFEESTDGGTLLKVSTGGAFTGDPALDAGVAHQTIELANVNLMSLGSDMQIIETLISQNKLITE